MSTRMRMEIEGLSQLTNRLNRVGADTKKIAEKALKESHLYTTNLAEEGIQDANLPAKGKYSNNHESARSLYKEASIEWVGNKASVQVGFSIRKGGLPTIFMIYGTPRHMKVQKLWNALNLKKSRRTREEIKKIQEDVFYDELRRLGG